MFGLYLLEAIVEEMNDIAYNNEYASSDDNDGETNAFLIMKATQVFHKSLRAKNKKLAVAMATLSPQEINKLSGIKIPSHLVGEKSHNTMFYDLVFAPV
ncbi:hypothetical protein Trydic_g19584 [Trypoxylus dichotomus]